MKNVLITGAGSGIGKSVALHHARLSHNLFLIGRRREKLEATKIEALLAGARHVEVFPLDVRIKDSLENVIFTVDDTFPLDFAYVNAGVSAGTLGGEESALQVKNLIDTNIFGAIFTLHAALLRMKKRGTGNIVVLSSVASFFPLPSAPTYSATKVFIRNYAESLAISCKRNSKICISVICPGFVETEMTAINEFRMPFLIKPEKAASLIYKAALKGKLRFIFPWPMFLLIKLSGICGIFIISRLLAKLPGKSSL